MFILARNPYDIGDRISINLITEVPLADGESTWYVDEVTLYHTTVRLGSTNEVATISNYSLSTCRIVNAARSTKAIVYVRLNFGVDVPYSRIELFKETVETFVKARPREWLCCASIRATVVEANLGYVEYTISLQHRDSWQNLGNISASKAALMSFCLEVQNQLDMKYTMPHTPVDLNLMNPQALNSMLQGEADTILRSPAPLSTPQREQLDQAQAAKLRKIADMFTVTS